jgi:hypothetical protein
MMDDKDLLYDDGEAVKFIRNRLPEALKGKFSDDDINYVIDLIYDFYDAKGYIDEDDDDREVEINEDELTAYVVKNALSDGVAAYDADDVALIVEGEMAYCESIGIFE